VTKVSDEFEQIVYLIQRQLRNHPDTIVTASKKLVDRNSGKKRQVDVVVEANVSGSTLIVGIEARTSKRKRSIEWVEQQIKKHEHLSDKLILVANQGFAEDALDLARRHGVETVEFSETVSPDWPALIDGCVAGLVFEAFEFAPSNSKFRYGRPEGAPDLSADGEPAILRLPDGQSGAPLVVLNALIRSRRYFGDTFWPYWSKLPKEQRSSGHIVDYKFTPQAGLPWWLEQGGWRYPLQDITSLLTVNVLATKLQARLLQYKDTRVLQATSTLQAGSLAGQTIHFAATERAGERPKGTLALSGGQITDLELDLPSG
jgi:hypothetical protein